MRDPIYSAYTAEYQSSLKELADVEKELEAARSDASKPDVMGGLPRVVRQRNLAVIEAKLGRVKQESEFKRVRCEVRKREARLSYNRAMNAGRSWPDPNEFTDFRRTLELRSRPRSWTESESIRLKGLDRAPAGHGEESGHGGH